MTGRVVSTKLKNTATVLVSRIATHALYKKTYVRTKRFLVDDQIGVKDGDIVEIIKCKPVSKNKHWRINKIIGANLLKIAEDKLKQAAAAAISEVMPEEKEESSKEIVKTESNENTKKEVKESKKRVTKKGDETSS